VFLWLPDTEPRHATLTLTPQGVRLKHLGKAGDTYVNGEAVRERLLRHGDVIGLGEVRLRLCQRHAGRAPEASSRVKFVKPSADVRSK
jgi:pSer/pThr/pTyr-binding forkhead associated (FHA) protein